MSKHTTRRDRSSRPTARSSEESDASAAGHRHARLSQILREEIAAVTRGELFDPALDGVVVTAVDLSVDYRNARVRFVVPRALPASRGDRERLERAMARAAPFLRSRLSDALDLKQAPALRFVWGQDAAERPEGWTEGS